jgi:hypothetical protein
MTLASISVEFTVPLVPVEPMVSADYYVYSLGELNTSQY